MALQINRLFGVAAKWDLDIEIIAWTILWNV